MSETRWSATVTGQGRGDGVEGGEGGKRGEKGNRGQELGERVADGKRWERGEERG